MRKKRIITNVLSFGLTFVVFNIINLISHNGIYGDATVLKWDATGQYINWMAYLMDILKGNSQELYYTLSMTPGNGNALLIGWYLLSPFNLLLLLFDKASLPDAYFWIECLKISTAGFTMSVFLSKMAQRKKVFMTNTMTSIFIILFSLAYSYGGFIAAHTHELLYFDTYLILPLLADGLISLCYDGKVIQYYLCLTYAIITNFYFGFMACVFCLLCYIYLNVRSRQTFGRFIQFVILSCLAAGTSAVVLLPIIYQVPLSKMSGSNTSNFRLSRMVYELAIVVAILLLVLLLIRILKSRFYKSVFRGRCILVVDCAVLTVVVYLLHAILNKLAWHGDYFNRTILFPSRWLMGVFRIEDYQPNGLMSLYGSMLLVVLFLFYLFDYRADQRLKIINIETLLFCYFMMGFKQLNFVWHGFTFPAGSFYRWAFFISFFILAIAAEYLFDSYGFEQFSIQKLIACRSTYLSIVSIALVSLLCIHYYIREKYTYLDYTTIALNALLFIAYLVLLSIGLKKKKKLSGMLFCAFLCCEIVLNAVVSLRGFVFTSYDEYQSYVNTQSKIMNTISLDNNSDLFRIESDYKQEWYYIGGYNSVYHSSSAYTKSNRDYLINFGMGVDNEASLLGAQNNFELDPLLAGFLGIRYLISENDLLNNEYELINTFKDDYSGKVYNLYRNTNALPLVFRMNKEVLNRQQLDDPDELMQVVEEIQVDYENGLKKNGLSEYQAKIFLDEGEAIVWQLPFNEGWSIYIDGQLVESKKAYGFLLAAETVPGEHNVIIKYRPPYMNYGLMITMISAILACIFVIFGKDLWRFYGRNDYDRK